MGKKKIEESQNVPTTSPDLLTGANAPSAESVGQRVGDVPREYDVMETVQDATAKRPRLDDDVASNSLPDAGGVHSPSSVMGMDDELEATRQHYQAMNPTAKCIVHPMGAGFSVSWVDQ